MTSWSAQRTPLLCIGIRTDLDCLHTVSDLAPVLVPYAVSEPQLDPKVQRFEVWTHRCTSDPKHSVFEPCSTSGSELKVYKEAWQDCTL